MEKEEETKNETEKYWIIFGLITLFIYNGMYFIIIKGNAHPLLSYLFNIIISIIVMITHEKDLDERKSEMIRQTRLDKYYRMK